MEPRNRILIRLAFCLCIVHSGLRAGTFDAQFESIKKAATRGQLYSLLLETPKGGDLHNHLGGAFLAGQLYEFAVDPKRSNGNEFYTRTLINNCPDSTEPLILLRTIQRSTYQAMSPCRQKEYQKLASLSPALKAEWISSMMLDREGEGRNEFFEVRGKRMAELAKDPWLTMEMLVQTMKNYSAQGLRYLETQTGTNIFQDHEGQPFDAERAVALYKETLARPDAKATGLTVRFLWTIGRYSPDAEEALERAYKFVAAHRDLWVGINMAGREDNGKGYALRLLETFRKMRRTYSNIPLSLHGGEVDPPGQDVRHTLMLGATRIGHGVNLITDPDTMLLMQNGKYLVEINLISNRLLEYVPDLSKHPFPEYLRFGIPVCLNQDDPGAWDSNMTDEYFTAVTNFNLTWSEIVQIGRDSLRYSFVEPPVKEGLLKEYTKAIAQFEEKYGDDTWSQKLAGVKPEYSGYAARNFGLAGAPGAVKGIDLSSSR
jgi:adenosine deaminase CECR1